MKIREDLKPGNAFPDFALPDHDGVERSLRQIHGGWPTILVFWRGRY